MLILQRKEGESIQIGDNIEVRVVEIGNGMVRIAIDAPKSIQIVRSELLAAADVNQESLSQTVDFAVLQKFAQSNGSVEK